MRKRLWLRLYKILSEFEGRQYARDKSLVERNQLHAWICVQRNKAGTKKIIRYAIYRNGRRVRGAKLDPKKTVARVAGKLLY